jgi:hypothetical protein
MEVFKNILSNNLILELYLPLPTEQKRENETKNSIVFGFVYSGNAVFAGEPN